MCCRQPSFPFGGIPGLGSSDGPSPRMSHHSPLPGPFLSSGALAAAAFRSGSEWTQAGKLLSRAAHPAHGRWRATKPMPGSVRIVMDFGSRLRLADDAIPAVQVAPIDPPAIGQQAILWHRDEYSLIPQMRGVAAIGLQRTGQESDVQTLLPERRQMLRHTALGEFSRTSGCFDANDWISSGRKPEASDEKIPMRTACLAAPQQTAAEPHLLHLIERADGEREKLPARRCDAHPAVVPCKQRYSDPVVKVANASADG